MPRKKTIEQVLERFNNEYIMNPRHGQPFGRIPNSIDCGYIRFTSLKNESIIAYYVKSVPLVSPSFRFPTPYEGMPIIYQKI